VYETPRRQTEPAGKDDLLSEVYRAASDAEVDLSSVRSAGLLKRNNPTVKQAAEEILSGLCFVSKEPTQRWCRSFSL
jgi:hypothetical protein